MISLIVAVDQKLGIGKNNDLLCYLPADLRHFKQITTGNSIIMGRNTFDSLPNGALPNRKNIVITSRPESLPVGCYSATSITEAVKLANSEEVFIIGGDSVYHQTIGVADKLYITHIESSFEADRFFPPVDPTIWQLIKEEYHAPDEKNKYAYRFTEYIRK